MRDEFTTPLVDAIDLLFQRLLLVAANTRSDPDIEHAFSRVRSMLRVEDEARESDHFGLKLRLAMHLAPVDAIAYNPKRPESRVELVENYLIRLFGRNPEDASLLARDIVRVLRAWDEGRGPTASGLLPELLLRQGRTCASCHVALAEDVESIIDHSDRSPVSLRQRDPYKPYYLAPSELLRAEIDHVQPISRLGLHDLKNFQVLCRLCNAGKGDRLGIDIRNEAKYAGVPIVDVPKHFRSEMLYSILSRAGSKCERCGSGKCELTTRKIHNEGGYLRSNLLAECVNCAYG